MLSWLTSFQVCGDQELLSQN